MDFLGRRGRSLDFGLKTLSWSPKFVYGWTEVNL